VRATLLFAFAAAVLACAPRMTVVPTGSAQSYPSRGPDCRVEFYRVKAPDRPYDEVAALNLQGSGLQSITDAQELMRKEACGVGADAVVITRDFAVLPGGTSMIGSAVRYRDLTPMQRAARDRPLTLLERPAPEGYCVASVMGAVAVNARSSLRYLVVATLTDGTQVWTPANWTPALRAGTSLTAVDPGREVRLPDGTQGYVEPGAVGPCLLPSGPPRQPSTPAPIDAPRDDAI
jgi:hypothetical protein